MTEELIYHPRLGFIPKPVPILDEEEEEILDPLKELYGQ